MYVCVCDLHHRIQEMVATVGHVVCECDRRQIDRMHQSSVILKLGSKTNAFWKMFNHLFTWASLFFKALTVCSITFSVSFY